MKIVIRENHLSPISENYSEYEDGDVVSVLSDVCKILDATRFAEFTVIFSNWDSIFIKADFSYDFASIAYELESLLTFLKLKKESFILPFDELNRKVILNFTERNLKFEIITLTTNDIVSKGILNLLNFQYQIESLLQTFRGILAQHFPVALDIFFKNKYIYKS